jgi:uncharacterized phage protein (TIGR02218 family)
VKIIPPALAPNYTGAGSTLAQFLRMTLRDTAVVGANSTDSAITIDGVIYRPWLQVSDLVSSASLGVDNLELTVVTDEADLLSDLEAGRYDNASFYLFETNFLDPSDGLNSMKRGTTGEAKLTDSGSYTLEFRGLTQALQQTVGSVTSKTCRAHFADYPKQALGNKCGLVAADWTVTGTITNVASRQVVTDSARSEITDKFTEGFLKFTDGLNAGYERQIKGYTTGGEFVFVLAFPFTIEVGDAYSAIRGCRKRHIQDCKNEFNNLRRFQGEPYLPGADALTKVPGVGT